MSVKVVRLLDSIKGDVEDFELMGGIGIQDFSRSTAKLVLKDRTVNELLELRSTNTKLDFIHRMAKLDGIAEMTAEKIWDGLDKFRDEIVYLNIVLEPKVYKEQFRVDEQTYNLCITGTLLHYNRNDLKDLLEKRGHKFSGGVV